MKGEYFVVEQKPSTHFIIDDIMSVDLLLTLFPHQSHYVNLGGTKYNPVYTTQSILEPIFRYEV